MAISSSAKRFVASPIVQSVVNDIYSGRVIYSSSANRSIVADNYKLRAIEIYNSRNAPWLNHYRFVPLLSTTESGFIRISLRVPRYGAIFEFLNFAYLLVTFILCLFCTSLAFSPLPTFSLILLDKDLNTPNAFEVLFIVFATAFALKEYTASIEHGWSGECGHHDVLLTLLIKISVYFANVSNGIIIRRLTFPNQYILDVECLR